MTFIHVVDILRDTCNICQVNVYLHSAMRMMKYDPGKIVILGCKLHV